MAHKPVLQAKYTEQSATNVPLSTKGKRGGGSCVGRGFRRWQMATGKISTFTMNTFTLPSFSAPSTSSVTSCAKSFT